MTNEIYDFLRTGTLVGISLGMSISGLIALLGESGAQFDAGINDTRVIKYGAIQVTVSGEKLVAISVGCNGELLPPQFKVRKFINPTIDLYAFLQELDDNGIGWSVYPKLTFDRQLTIRTVGLVDIIIDLDARRLDRFYLQA